MLDKIKDLFYNISDLIVALLIISLAAYIISWKVEDIMNYPSMAMAQIDKVDDSTDLSSDEIIYIPNHSDPDVSDNSDTENGEHTENDQIDEENADPDTEQDQSTETETETEQEIEAETPSQPANKIIIDIPSGSPGVKIASMLQEKGLIDSSSEFIKRLEERKLDAKLRAGKFKIPENASLDEVIDILTGQ